MCSGDYIFPAPQGMEGENLSSSIMDMVDTLIDFAMELYLGDTSHPDEWDIEGMMSYLGKICIPPLYEYGCG